MKIGIEIQRLFRPKKHGMDIVALQLIRNLQELDQDNEYILFVKEDEDDTCIRETANFRIERIPSSPYPYWEQMVLPRVAAKHNVDLLHCTSNTAPIRLSVPLLLTLHDIIFLEQLSISKGSLYQSAGNLYRRWIVPTIAKQAAHLVTVSDYERNNILRYFGFPESRVTTIHNGVDTGFRRVTDHTKLDLVRKKYALPERYIFYFGNTDPRKNTEGVLRALSLLRKSKGVPITVIMGGVNQQYLNQIAEKIGDREVLQDISLCGYIDEGDLAAVYSMADLFLFPSLREGFGIPVIEAMACEVAVITSNVSSMPEVAGDAAYFIDPTKPEMIAEAISYLVTNESVREELVEKGKKRAAIFTWKETASRYLEVYHNILKRGDGVGQSSRA